MSLAPDEEQSEQEIPGPGAYVVRWRRYLYHDTLDDQRANAVG